MKLPLKQYNNLRFQTTLSESQSNYIAILLTNSVMTKVSGNQSSVVNS